MSYCARIQNIIDEADKPDLIPHEATSHLNGCRECRSFAAERSKLHELMSLSGRVTAPVNFNALLNERLSRVKSQKTSWFNARNFVRLGTATAGLALALLVAQYSGLLSNGPVDNNRNDKLIAGTDDPPQRPPEPDTTHQATVEPQSPVPPTGGGGGYVHPVSTGGRATTVRPPQETQARGIPIFIVRDRGREVEVPMLPVSVGMQQQVLNSSSRLQARSSDISY